jgi:hypothetical protein
MIGACPIVVQREAKVVKVVEKDDIRREAVPEYFRFLSDNIIKTTNSLAVMNAGALIACFASYKDLRVIFGANSLAVIATLFAVGLLTGAVGQVATVVATAIFGAEAMLSKEGGFITEDPKSAFVAIGALGLSAVALAAGLIVTIFHLWSI